MLVEFADVENFVCLKSKVQAGHNQRLKPVANRLQIEYPNIFRTHFELRDRKSHAESILWQVLEDK